MSKVQSTYQEMKSSLDQRHADLCESHKLWKKGTWILCDIAPGDELQFFKSKYIAARGNGLWGLFLSHIETLEAYTSRMETVMEISKKGRLHFHINAKLKNPTDFVSYMGYLNNKLDVRTDMDTIADLDYRQAYVRKDEENIIRSRFYDRAVAMNGKTKEDKQRKGMILVAEETDSDESCDLLDRLPAN